jgi:hypothetical protein
MEAEDAVYVLRKKVQFLNRKLATLVKGNYYDLIFQEMLAVEFSIMAIESLTPDQAQEIRARLRDLKISLKPASSEGKAGVAPPPDLVPRTGGNDDEPNDQRAHEGAPGHPQGGAPSDRL